MSWLEERLDPPTLVGSRVRLLSAVVDPWVTIPVGSTGTVEWIDDAVTAFVEWDSGEKLGIFPGIDRWEVISDG